MAFFLTALHSANEKGLPKNKNEWVGALLRLCISACWGSIIGGLLTGTGYNDLHLVYALSGISGWMGTDFTISVLKKLFKIDDK